MLDCLDECAYAESETVEEEFDSEDVSDDDSKNIPSKGMLHAQVRIQNMNDVVCSNDENNNVGKRDLDLNYDWGANSYDYLNLNDALTFIQDWRETLLLMTLIPTLRCLYTQMSKRKFMIHLHHKSFCYKMHYHHCNSILTVLVERGSLS